MTIITVVFKTCLKWHPTVSLAYTEFASLVQHLGDKASRRWKNTWICFKIFWW